MESELNRFFDINRTSCYNIKTRKVVINIKNFLSILSAIILIISLFALNLIINISTFFTIEKMQQNISKIDVVHEINKIKNSSATSQNKAEISDIINTAYDEAEKHGISDKLVDTIFNSKEIKTYLGSVAGTTTDYIINNNLNTITIDEFNQILDENIDNWIKKSKTEISDSKKEVLLVRMKNAGNQIINNLPTKEKLESALGIKNIKNIQFIFSNATKIILAALILISLIIIIITRRQYHKYLLYIGSSTLISSLFIIGTSFIIVDIITSMLTNYNLSFMTSTLNESLGYQIFISGIILCGISLIILFIYNILKKALH